MTPKRGSVRHCRHEGSDTAATSPSKRRRTCPAVGCTVQRLEAAGPWAPVGPLTHAALKWFDLADSANFSLNFGVRRLRMSEGALEARRFVFGVQSSRRNYAFPCADLALHNLTWAGVASRDVCLGAGGSEVMTAFWEDIDHLPDVALDVPLYCALTVDDIVDPQEMLWQVVRSSGHAVFSIPLRPCTACLPGSESARKGAPTQFQRVAVGGPWAPANLVDYGHHGWLAMARAAHLVFDFGTRHFRSSGASFTFGAQMARKKNYALPCANLSWDRWSWTGPATREHWKGSGSAVMESFWDDISRQLGGLPENQQQLSCVLTADNPGNPKKVTMQLVKPGGQLVTSVQFKRIGAATANAWDRLWTRLDAPLAFKSFAGLGQWTPTNPSDLAASPWKVWRNWSGLPTDEFQFVKRQWVHNGTRLPVSVVFGVQSNRDNYAFPCVDLSWDGQSWTGLATPLQRKGSGRGVLPAFWDDIAHSRGLGADAPLLCELTFDDAQDPVEMVWRIVDAVPRTLLSINLVRAASAVAAFQRLEHAGPWSPWFPPASGFPLWFKLADASGLQLNFQRRNVPGRSPQRLQFTFGAQGSGYALPCVELERGGRIWVGKATQDDWLGNASREVMTAFWADIRGQTGGAMPWPLSCVLTADDADDPQEVVWQLRDQADEVVISLPMSRSTQRYDVFAK